MLADCDGGVRGQRLNAISAVAPAQARAATARQHEPAEKNVAADAAREQESLAPWWEPAALVGVQTSTPRRLDGTHSGAELWRQVEIAVKCVGRFHGCPASPVCGRGTKKGLQDLAVGRSRGRLTSKIRLA
ncbi:hypothetical protein ACFYZT_33350 [Streptomyces sp. NPDC001591]|uniref:hypothetical protein n=1 Tax=Streptomyces sp. NPDC001591 TaxID=3364589 RepID=UPI0036CB2053